MRNKPERLRNNFETYEEQTRKTNEQTIFALEEQILSTQGTKILRPKKNLVNTWSKKYYV
jgi:hypothetical protein